MSADSRRERVVIINSNGRHLPSGQFALLTQAYPHLVTLTRAALQPEPLRTSDRDDLLLSRARVANQVALIPDLDMNVAEIARPLSPARVPRPGCGQRPGRTPAPPSCWRPRRPRRGPCR